MAKTWLEYVHPHAASMMASWQKTHALYSGEGVDSHLVMYRQGESQTQFEERRQLAHFTPYLGDTLDTVAAGLFQRLPDVERDWGVLGNQDTVGTIAHRLFTSIDGAGKDYEVMLHEAALDLLLYQEVWVLVDGPSTDEMGNTSDATVKLFSPTAVPNWVEGVGGMKEVLVKETVVGAGNGPQTSLVEEPLLQDQYVRYTPTGWERWRLAGDDHSREAVMIASGNYAEDDRAFVTRAGIPTAPIFRVRLPFRRYVASQLADGARTLYNLESDRDALLRAASHPKLQLVASDEEAQSVVKGLKRGSNIVVSNPDHTRDHAYIGPPTEGAEELRLVIDQKVQAFTDTAFKLYDAEARVAQTATEASINRSQGIGAVLSTMAASVEELETQALHLLEQTYSTGPFSSSASWPRDYSQAEAQTPEGPDTP